MVDPSMPWSLKGISDEARTFAKQSADNADMPVGVWLSEVIRAAADAPDAASLAQAIDTPPNPVAPPQPAPAASPAPAPVQEAKPTGSTIERAAQIVDDFGFEPEGPARDADLIEDPAILQAELEALERRLENGETNTQDKLSPLIDEIDRIKSRLAGSSKN